MFEFLRKLPETPNATARWICLLLVLNGASSGLVAEADDPIDFDTQIMAVISKNGCNAAACHGSSGGRGGFQLSLFGSDPDLDYDQIVRERYGRRIHRTDPSNSLILLKATDSIAHEGGLRFAADSREYGLIRDWIAQGSRRVHSRQLQRIVIDPPSIALKNEGDSALFKVMASFEDGTTVDVSQDAVVSLLDDESLQLEEMKIIARRPGLHSVLVRYLDQVGLMQVTLPYSAGTIADLPSRGFIDDAINAGLNRLGIEPVLVADDLTLYRRLSLDLLGELPDFSDAQSFANSPEPDKYERLVDRMLADDRFVNLWTWHLAEWLRVGGSGQNETVANNYQEWIRKRVAGDASLARLAEESLTATGDAENGATGFYRLTNEPGIQAELACNTWMGVRIGCANCHNHPLDHWKRTEYFQFAGFFAGIRRDGDVRMTTNTTLINPVTRKLAIAALPDGIPLDSADPRRTLADWLASTDNPYFAHSTANRTWAILMGRGVYEPVDDFRATNPVSNRDLLDGLAEFQRANNFELRPLVRAIVVSEAYRRQTTSDPVTGQDRFYWRFMSRELPAPVLFDSIEQVTFGEQHSKRREWLSVSIPTQFPELTVLGQCDRNANCLPSASTGASNRGLTENLEFMNGSILNERILIEQGFLKSAIGAGESDRVILESLYSQAFSRLPEAKEEVFWMERLAGNQKPADRILLWQDIIWSILNSREFVTNH